jgi:hypothetical protein
VALLLPSRTLLSVYLIAAATMLLLFIGIHNAWDVVAWITTERHARKYQRREPGSPEPPGRRESEATDISTQPSEGRQPPSPRTPRHKGRKHAR